MPLWAGTLVQDGNSAAMQCRAIAATSAPHSCLARPRAVHHLGKYRRWGKGVLISMEIKLESVSMGAGFADRLHLYPLKDR